MDHKLILNVTETVNAPVETVWKAITDKAMIKKYFFGTEVESNWQVGGPLIFKGTWEGKPYEDKGTILAMEKEKLFRYNYWSNMSGIEDIPENYATITYELQPNGQGTIFKITQQGFNNKEAYEHSTQGWGIMLKNLKELLEG